MKKFDEIMRSHSGYVSCSNYNLVHLEELPFWNSQDFWREFSSRYQTPDAHFYRRRVPAPPPPPNVHLKTDDVNIDILYIIVKGILRRFRCNLNFSKYFDFSILQAIFVKWVHLGSFLEILMRTELVESRQAIYHFKACELEKSKI